MKLNFDLFIQAIDVLPKNVVLKIKDACSNRIKNISNSDSYGFSLGSHEFVFFKRFFVTKKIDNKLVSEFFLKPRELSKFTDNDLPWLLIQDWSYLFSVHGYESKNCCVYLHHDRSCKDIKSVGFFDGLNLNLKKSPFYVGQGKISRPYDFKERDSLHKRILKEKLSDCNGDKNKIVTVVAKGLKKSEALELEAKLIYFYRPLYYEGSLINIQSPIPKMAKPLSFGKMGGISSTKTNRMLLGEALSDLLLQNCTK